MTVQDIKALCKLDLAEFEQMTRMAYNFLIKDKTPDKKEAKYIIGNDVSRNKFLFANPQDIILSLDIIAQFHPFYTMLMVNYPNYVKQVLYDDCLLCLRRLLHLLGENNYKIVISDLLAYPELMDILLNDLIKLGYSTELIVLKNGIFDTSINNIYEYAISLILKNYDYNIEALKLSMSDITGLLDKGLISKAFIMDSLISSSVMKLSNTNMKWMLGLNPCSFYTEPYFYTRLEKIHLFIGQYKRFMSSEDHNDLKRQISLLEDSYYNSIDISFFTRSRNK